MLQLFELQREIYAAMSANIKTFADSRSWFTLLAMLPMGIVFGAVHALTPGHSKSVLAAYVAGSPARTARALLAALALSFTHVTSAVLIAALSLPLVSVALGSAGRAPALENLSRGLLVLIGLWMVWRTWRRTTHRAHEGEAFGFAAGLVPCPLTLFVMTLAISKGAALAGIAFAAAMMAGVALTLAAVALAVTLFRAQMESLLRSRPELLHRMSRIIESLAGLALAAIALAEILR